MNYNIICKYKNNKYKRTTYNLFKKIQKNKQYNNTKMENENRYPHPVINLLRTSDSFQVRMCAWAVASHAKKKAKKKKIKKKKNTNKLHNKTNNKNLYNQNIKINRQCWHTVLNLLCTSDSFSGANVCVSCSIMRSSEVASAGIWTDDTAGSSSIKAATPGKSIEK